jgi:ATP-dependent exoDNAse (exonuclease V) beta subunit
MKYSTDGKCEFNPENHTYTVNGKLLKSVTTFISEHKNKFDSEGAAEKYALKHGLEKSLVLSKWKQLGEIACQIGTAVHYVFEHYILHNQILTTGNYGKEKTAVKFICEMFFTDRLIPVATEIIVYDEILGISGTIDCICKNSKNQYFILDWKTNEIIQENNYGKMMLRPFSHIPDCTLYHYSMQLSLYKKLCKEYKIEDIFIVHINHNDYKIIKAQKL